MLLPPELLPGEGAVGTVVSAIGRAGAWSEQRSVQAKARNLLVAVRAAVAVLTVAAAAAPA